MNTEQMTLSKQIAKHFRDVHFGGNWTCSNLKDNVKGLSWQQAITKVHSFNTIATLVFHVNYFVDVMLKVLEGKGLSGDDKLSFDHPPVNSQDDWQKMLDKTFSDAEKVAALLETLPEKRLWENLSLAPGGEKYGNYYRNIHGIIEHTHYHLGQIAIIKKMVAEAEKK